MADQTLCVHILSEAGQKIVVGQTNDFFFADFPLILPV